jgi:hypothetical protein
MRLQPPSLRRAQRSWPQALVIARPSHQRPSPPAGEATAIRRSWRQGRVRAPRRYRVPSRRGDRGLAHRRSRRQEIESRTWCRISRLAVQAYRSWDSAPSHPSKIRVMNIWPLAVGRLWRMVHRGLTEANTPMYRSGWPARGGAATIPLCRSETAARAALGSNHRREGAPRGERPVE